jgi:hypothetical protein
MCRPSTVMFLSALAALVGCYSDRSVPSPGAKKATPAGPEHLLILVRWNGVVTKPPPEIALASAACERVARGWTMSCVGTPSVIILSPREVAALSDLERSLHGSANIRPVFFYGVPNSQGYVIEIWRPGYMFGKFIGLDGRSILDLEVLQMNLAPDHADAFAGIKALLRFLDQSARRETETER